MAIPVFGAEIATAQANPKTLARMIEEAHLHCAAASLALTRLVAVHAGKMQFQWGGWVQALAADADTLSENVAAFRNRARRAGEGKILPQAKARSVEEVQRAKQERVVKARAKINRKAHPWRVTDHQEVVRHKRRQEEKSAHAHP